MEVQKDTDSKSLTISGGYIFPWYMEIYCLKMHIDVVEIDPTVIKIVYEHLKITKSTRINSYNTDGRWFIMNCMDKYDVVFTDAYNNLFIPYHLATKEFAQNS